MYILKSIYLPQAFSDFRELLSQTTFIFNPKDHPEYYKTSRSELKQVLEDQNAVKCLEMEMPTISEISLDDKNLDAEKEKKRLSPVGSLIGSPDMNSVKKCRSQKQVQNDARAQPIEKDMEFDFMVDSRDFDTFDSSHSGVGGSGVERSKRVKKAGVFGAAKRVKVLSKAPITAAHDRKVFLNITSSTCSTRAVGSARETVCWPGRLLWPDHLFGPRSLTISDDFTNHKPEPKNPVRLA